MKRRFTRLKAQHDLTSAGWPALECFRFQASTRSSAPDQSWECSATNRWAERGALIGLGIPEYKPKRYEAKIKRGTILLSVHAGDASRREKATRVLEETGPEVVDSSSEPKGDLATSVTPDRWRHF